MAKLSRVIQENMTAIGAEEKEACIHCKKIWYRIHHSDGVCHKCQLLERPGRTELAVRKRRFRRAIALGVLIFCLMILRAILN